jgi:TetR/AcrR family transcriptional regulator, regulator of cefoperazone and chloramphenicol sensitivity
MCLNMASHPPDKAATRQRLLESAGEVFAEHGFRATTVRAICRHAGANIAAVNYHFGDKRALYAAVVRYAHSCAADRHPIDPAGSHRQPPEQRLRAFVHGFLMRLLDQGRPAWHGKLMAREMVEPGGALDELVEKAIRPQFLLLAGIVTGLVGELDEVQLRRACISVVCQCLFYHHARPVIVRLFPALRLEQGEIAELTEHIATFTISGLEALYPRGRARGTRR